MFEFMKRLSAATSEQPNGMIFVPVPFPGDSHRERLLAMQVEHLQICRPSRCKQLSQAGVCTAGDLLYCDPMLVAKRFRNPERAARAIRRIQSAVQLSISVDSMMPRDAMLLSAIHRRSVTSLAQESAAVLYRDLERFSLSSQGSRLIGRRGIPSLRRIKIWVANCKKMAQQLTHSDSPVASAA